MRFHQSQAVFIIDGIADVTSSLSQAAPEGSAIEPFCFA